MPNNKPSAQNSLWKQTTEPLPYMDCVRSDIETDLLIIGAGYTGLSCALHSADTTNDIVVIDQDQPGWGCSGRNGGQVNPQWKPSLSYLKNSYQFNF